MRKYLLVPPPPQRFMILKCCANLICGMTEPYKPEYLRKMVWDFLKYKKVLNFS